MADPSLAHSGRILVVEDDPVQSHALTAILRHEGFAVDNAATAAEALNRLKAPSVLDVLLLDVGLGPGWETPTGMWPIQRRVERETMEGATLKGQGPSGVGASYLVEYVRWTQYFTADGSAIHENYWRDPTTFGIPGSHGCVGMLPEEAQWFWRWATVGTPLVVHAE